MVVKAKHLHRHLWLLVDGMLQSLLKQYYRHNQHEQQWYVKAEPGMICLSNIQALLAGN